MPRIYQRYETIRAPDPISRGFSLIELMVTIAIAAVLLALALPSFTSLINSNRLAGAANELVAGLQFARIESVRRNERTILCKSANGSSCDASAAGPWGGWIVLTADQSTVLQAGVLKAPVQLLASNAITAGAVVFRPDGFVRNSATPTGSVLAASFAFCIPTQKPMENVRLVSVTGGSRFAVDRKSADGQCVQPENSSS